MGDEPIYMLGRARAEFGLGRFTDTVATLDQLRQKWPDYQSAEGHLLYARALEGSDQLKEAADEYAAVSNYYPGAEARVRYALLLRKAGRDREAHNLLDGVAGPDAAGAPLRAQNPGRVDQDRRTGGPRLKSPRDSAGTAKK